MFCGSRVLGHASVDRADAGRTIELAAIDAMAQQQEHPLPEDVLAFILALDALASAACTAAVRLVDHCFRRCRDGPLKQLTIDGTKIASVPNHFADAARLVEAFSRHMHVLTCLQITHLPSFGPLHGLPSSLHAQLKRLELLHCKKLLHGGDKSLAFHLRGISGLVNLRELVLSAPRTNKGGCSLRMLAQLLLPCRQLSLLDLRGARWLTSPKHGLKPLAQLPGLQSLSLSNCPQLRGLPSSGSALQLLQRLTALHLGECPWSHGLGSLKWSLSSLAACSSLQTLSLLELDAEQRPEVQRAAFSLARLQHLTLCPGDHALPDLVACTQLLSLHLLGCSKAGLELRPLRTLTRLTRLEVSGGGSVRDLEPLQHLRASLHSLELQSMASSSLHTLGLLTRLHSLELGEMDSEASALTLQPLSSLTCLTRLSLHWIDSFPGELDVGPLSTLTLLEVLAISTDNVDQGEKVLGLPQLLAQPPRLPGISELEIPLDSDAWAAPLALLTRLTELCVLNSGGVSGALLAGLRPLPGLQQLSLRSADSFPAGCLLQLSGFQALRMLGLDGCLLGSAQLEELRLGGTQLTQLDLGFAYGFSSRALGSLERDGLLLSYDGELDDDGDEEPEAEPQAWMERFRQLPDVLKLRVLDHWELPWEDRGTSRGSLRLVCQQWRRLVDSDVKHLTLDASVLLAQAPPPAQAGSSTAPGSAPGPAPSATPGPGWRAGLRPLLSRFSSLTALNVTQLQLLGPGAADLVFGQLPSLEAGRPPSHKAHVGHRAGRQAGGSCGEAAAGRGAAASALTGLRSLRVSVPQLDDTELQVLGLTPHLSQLRGLTELTIAAVTRADDHTPPRHLTSLVSLVAALKPLEHLHWLSLAFCQGLRSASALTRLAALRDLELSGLSHEAAACSVSALVQLTRLSLKGLGTSLISLDFLRPLTRLRDLLLDWKSYPCYRTMQLMIYEDGGVDMASFMHSHEVLDSLPPLPQLRLLQLECAAVRSLEGLRSCPSLEVLNLLDNGPFPLCLDTLSSTCTQLERLDLCCSCVDGLAPLQRCSSLQQLTLCLAERGDSGGGDGGGPAGNLLQELARHPPPHLQELRLARYQFLNDDPPGGDPRRRRGGGARAAVADGFQRLRLHDVAALLVHCPSLQRLRLSSIRGLTYRLLDLMLYCKHPQQSVTYCTLDLVPDLAAGAGPAAAAGEEEEQPAPEGPPRLRQLAMSDFYHRKDRKFPAPAFNAATVA